MNTYQKVIKLLLIIGLLPMLSACQEIGKGGRLADKEIRKSVDATKDALERVFTYYPENEEYKPIPYSFCYRVMQDITCYDRPIPEARERLVGWQGRDGTFVKNTGALPSTKAAVKQEKSFASAESKSPSEVVASTSTANTETDTKKVKEKSEKEKAEKEAAKPLEPVFVKNPPIVKEEKIKVKVTESSSSALY
jgi:hypothetical protein